MPLKNPTQEVKEEIEFFIAGILNYDAQLNQLKGGKSPLNGSKTASKSQERSPN